MEFGEPRAGYLISGRHEDGTWHVFARDDEGNLNLIGTADDYESARDIAINDYR